MADAHAEREVLAGSIGCQRELHRGFQFIWELAGCSTGEGFFQPTKYQIHRFSIWSHPQQERADVKILFPAGERVTLNRAFCDHPFNYWEAPKVSGTELLNYQKHANRRFRVC